MSKWIWLIGFVAGCSFTFDQDAPEVPLVGNAPDMSKFPRLNNAPVLHEYYVIGADNHYWWTMQEAPQTLHALRLPDGGEEILTPKDDQDFTVYGSAIFFTSPKDPSTMGPVTLTIHVFARKTDDVFTLPDGPGEIGTAFYERIFYYWPMRSDAKTFLVLHRDRSVTREIAIPDGVDPTQPPQLSFNYYADLLLLRDAKDHVTAYSTVEDKQVDLGVLPQQTAFDNDDHTLITAGKDGVHRVPTDGNPPIVLDARATREDGWWFFRTKDGVDEVWYRIGDALWGTARDGTGTPHLVMDGGFARIIGFAPPDSQIVYSKDPSDRYIYGAGDGWLGDWRFMERGFGPLFTENGKRVYWLEHAAQSSGSGDLMTATVPNGTPEPLARSTYEMDSLSDGRILALTNRQSIGTWNRLVVIDQEQKTASWVAQAARSFHWIPGTEDQILVDVVTGATGHDVLRVPIPPKANADGGTPDM